MNRSDLCLHDLHMQQNNIFGWHAFNSRVGDIKQSVCLSILGSVSFKFTSIFACGTKAFSDYYLINYVD